MKKKKIIFVLLIIVFIVPLLINLLSLFNLETNTNSKYKKLEDKISILIKDNNNLKEDLNDVKNNLNLENLSNLESKLADLEENLSKIESDLESLGSNEELINELNDLRTEINNLKAELQILRGEIEESKLHHFALVGSMNDWDVDDITFLMNTEDNVVFTYTLENPNGDVIEFKIADNCSWDWQYGPQSVITNDTDYLKLDGENIVINKPGKYDLTLNVKTHQLDIIQSEIYKIDINIDLPDTMTLTPGLDSDPSIDVPEYVSYGLMYLYEDGSYQGDSSIHTLNPGTYTLMFDISEGKYNNRNSKNIIVEVLDYVDTNEFTLVGTMNEWYVEDTTYQLELKRPSTYECYIYLEEGTQFKIVNHLSWNESYGYDAEKISVGGDSSWFSGVDGNIQCNNSGVYQLIFNSFDKTIVLGTTTHIEIDGKYYVEDYNSSSLTSGIWKFNNVCNVYYFAGYTGNLSYSDSLGNEYTFARFTGSVFTDGTTSFTYTPGPDVAYPITCNEDGTIRDDYYLIFNEENETVLSDMNSVATKYKQIYSVSN